MPLSAAIPDDAAVLELASSLIACPSVTPEDGGSLDLIAKRLLPLGFTAERIDRKNVKNLWLRRGASLPLFCFAGHVDVVPPGPLENWTSPPFSPAIRDGFLYGRGAADMKTSIAAMIVATERFLSAHPDTPVSLAFLLTSDEEGEATDGTLAVVEALKARGLTLDYCLVGEPTAVLRLGDMVKIGRRGSLSGQLRVKGIQCHIAYPHLGKNPVLQLAPALDELAKTSWDNGDEHFQPTSWQISNIHAGTGANNVIPAFADVLFNFRYAPASTPESLQQRLNAILEKHGLDYQIDWTLGANPFLTKPGTLAEAAQKAIQKETGLATEFSTTGGTSDGRFLKTISREVIELGPVNESSHKIDENVLIKALPALSRIYQNILEQLFLRKS